VKVYEHLPKLRDALKDEITRLQKILAYTPENPAYVYSYIRIAMADAIQKLKEAKGRVEQHISTFHQYWIEVKPEDEQ